MMIIIIESLLLVNHYYSTISIESVLVNEHYQYY